MKLKTKPTYYTKYQDQELNNFIIDVYDDFRLLEPTLVTELPAPVKEYRGKFVLKQGDPDELYVCVETGSGYAWMKVWYSGEEGSGSGLDADKVDGYDTGRWNAIPVIRNDGVMEVGKFIDFHLSADSTADYEPRLTAAGQDLELWNSNGHHKIWHSGNMSKVFYVDSVNGDDENDGSQEAPFKTLQKAVDSIPVGGFCYINLVSDYTGGFETHYKKIHIHIHSGKCWTIEEGVCCSVRNSDITVLNEGEIIVKREDGTNINGDNYAGFGVSNFETFFLSSCSNFYLVNFFATNPVRIEEGRCLFGSRSYGTNQNIQMNLGIYNIYCSGDFVLDGYLFHLNNGVGSFQWNNYGNDGSFRIVDSNGNSVDITTKILGVIKDGNGVPRNILSNLIL